MNEQERAKLFEAAERIDHTALAKAHRAYLDAYMASGPKIITEQGGERLVSEMLQTAMVAIGPVSSPTRAAFLAFVKAIDDDYYAYKMATQD